MLSRTSRYALLAALALAQQPDRWLTAHQLALATGVPANYLTKILHAMARARLLQSQRGRDGGFRLARAADRISLFEVVALFEEPQFLSYCLLGASACPADRPCIAHARWLAVVETVTRFLAETTLADIARTADGQPVGPLTAIVSEETGVTLVRREVEDESHERRDPPASPSAGRAAERAPARGGDAT